MPTKRARLTSSSIQVGRPFEAEAARLRAALKALALRIDHHGSTAVPGLGAKPIIDIQVSVATLQPLVRVRCEARRHRIHSRAASGRLVLSIFPSADRLAPQSSRARRRKGRIEERRTLAFRDYLRDYADMAREYEDLKRTVAAKL